MYIINHRVEPYFSKPWLEELKKLLPDANSIEDGIEIYRLFYAPEKEKEFGVVVIQVELIVQVSSSHSN